MTSKKLKRYTLVLPEEIFNEVQTVADREQTTVVDILRRYVRVGLTLSKKLDDSRDAKLFIREDDRELEIILV